MKISILAIMGIVFFSGISYAQHIGPGVPPKSLDEFSYSPNFGIGYNYHQAKWDGVDGGEGFDSEQNRIYAHFGAVSGGEYDPGFEVYVRLGVVSMESEENSELGFQEFDGKTGIMYALGMKGELYQNESETIGFGAALQGLYIDSIEDGDIKFENDLEFDLAFPIHTKINKFLFYLGPVFYYSSADISYDNINSTESVDDTIEEDRNIGAFGGLVFRMRNISLEIETQYKSRLSAGALVTYTF